MGGTGGTQGGGSPPPEGKDSDGIGFSGTLIRGKLDYKGVSVASRYFRGLPEKGEAAAEFQEVFKSFEELAQDSLNREDIPLGYKEYIRRYFDSVRPKENE